MNRNATSHGRRLGRAALVATVSLLLMPGAASAHPLGNFTINHYSGLRVEPDRVLVDHVVDYAEIPTFQERQGMDRAGDGDGAVSEAEAATYRNAACARQADALRLVVGGAAVPFAAQAAAIQFPPGQAGAATLRLVCALAAPLSAPIGSATSVSFEDATYAGRIGWREITVVGDRTTVGAGPLGESPSGRLTAYPADLLAEPLQQQSSTFEVTPGGPALPPFTAPELAAAAPSAAPGTSPGGAGTAGCTDVTAGLPGGTSDFGREICELVQARDLTPAAIVVSLFAAALIGAAHAVSPGHGKTVMAAYLVGARGSLRHAVGLGLTVTVSHTIGVLALGGLTIYASTLLPPDRLQLFLGVASGGILIALGLYLVISRLRVNRSGRATTAWPAIGPMGGPALAQAGPPGALLIGELRSSPGGSAPEPDPSEGHGHPRHDHKHDPDEAPTSSHPHAHHHGSEPRHDHGLHARSLAEHDHADGEEQPQEGDGSDSGEEPGGYHSHGLFRHTHLPEELPNGGLSWRALFALGLSGGLVPSASAVIVLLVSISLGRPAYGIVLTIAFGLGMAVVLIGIGIALVYARGLIERMPHRGRFAGWMRHVPMATAVFVLVVGVLVTAQAIGQVS